MEETRTAVDKWQSLIAYTYRQESVVSAQYVCKLGIRRVIFTCNISIQRCSFLMLRISNSLNVLHNILEYTRLVIICIWRLGLESVQSLRAADGRL